ncbi:hypothetical protein ONZ43_g5297 [Nemania bipapillata]|uniref:Uncharacterized protein n=1 Tax=Nemania bipapillata TaxID=110536 RepID=A0ACC2ICH9_9PEZI|nr:hypothetical protein ONZ43_g5297 [Nemania bipapillata]
MKSWNVFNNNLVYRSAKKATENQAKDEDKGKGKEKEIDVIQIDSSSSSDSEQLQAQWETEDFLKAISAMKSGPEGSQKSEDAVNIKKEGGIRKKAAAGTSAKDSGAARKTTNAKGKSVAFKGADMEIDS